MGIGGAPAPPRARSLALFDHTDPRRLTTPGYGYLKVAEGCNNPCTFCAIPLWRGRFRSRTIESLVEEARQLEASGVQELCLIAQDTTRYGEDLGLGRHGLLRLVEALLAGTSVPWLRWLYAYPTTLDRELLRLMGSEERVCRYLDIPLQHSHPEILRGMRRAGDGDRYLALLDQARTVGARDLAAQHVHRRLPGRDRGALRASRALPRARGARSRRRLHLQRRGAARRRPRWRIAPRPRSRASARRACSSASGRSPWRAAAP